MNHSDIWSAADLFTAPKHISYMTRARGLNPVTHCRGKEWAKRDRKPWLSMHTVENAMCAAESDFHDFPSFIGSNKKPIK